MKTTSALRLRLVAAFTFVAAAGLALSAVQARGPSPDDQATHPSPRQAIAPPQVTMAERLFLDAPDGVDPMPTGPVSAEYRDRLDGLGCREAVWPNVPAACYPR